MQQGYSPELVRPRKPLRSRRELKPHRSPKEGPEHRSWRFFSHSPAAAKARRDAFSTVVDFPRRLYGELDGLANAPIMKAMQINDCALAPAALRQPRSINMECRLYEILTSARTHRDRKFTCRRGTRPFVKEAVMLDLVFVALGFALIGLMGLYAVALQQL